MVTTLDIGSVFALRSTYLGVVSEFDEAVGIGTISLDQGDVVGFHCTQIAGGSRTIAVGTKVTCSLLAVNLGVIEAGNILTSAL